MPIPTSGLWLWAGDGVGHQDLGPDRDGDRALRGAGRAQARASASRDSAGAGDAAPVPARGHAMAQPDGDRRARPAARPCAAASRDWAAIDRAGSGSTPCWSAMLRGHPDLILDSCSVRAKRGGDLTGPNPTDRGKRGHQVPHRGLTGDGVPVACAATAANVNDTLVFERLFLTAFAVVARIRTVFADKGYDAEHHRDLCRASSAPSLSIHKRGRPHGSGSGQAPLAGRAQQRLGAGEQAPGAPLRPPGLHHPVPAPGRLSLPGCRPPRQGIVTTAS